MISQLWVLPLLYLFTKSLIVFYKPINGLLDGCNWKKKMVWVVDPFFPINH
jgi:hypothetical protein